jgi:hypothetical protein
MGPSIVSVEQSIAETLVMLTSGHEYEPEDERELEDRLTEWWQASGNHREA